jgi:ATP adenylyltransferase
VGEVEDLKEEESSEMMALLQRSIKTLKAAYNPDGFNVGMNIGRTAGAGVLHHIHIHIVPRWNGDTNFMPVLGETKIISQGLRESFEQLKKHF